MRPQTVHELEFAVRDELLVRFTVRGGEKHVGRERDNMGFRFDTSERGGDITTAMSTDISVAPFPAHPDQVIRVHRQEVSFPEAMEEVLQRCEADSAPDLLFIEFWT